MKNNYFLKQEKTVVRSMKLFYIFKISLKSELAEDSWIRCSVFSFNTLLWLKEKKKNWPCTDMQLEKELREPPESVSITPASPQHTL